MIGCVRSCFIRLVVVIVLKILLLRFFYRFGCFLIWC